MRSVGPSRGAGAQSAVTCAQGGMGGHDPPNMAAIVAHRGASCATDAPRGGERSRARRACAQGLSRWLQRPCSNCPVSCERQQLKLTLVGDSSVGQLGGHRRAATVRLHAAMVERATETLHAGGSGGDRVAQRAAGRQRPGTRSAASAMTVCTGWLAAHRRGHCPTARGAGRAGHGAIRAGGSDRARVAPHVVGRQPPAVRGRNGAVPWAAPSRSRTPRWRSRTTGGTAVVRAALSPAAPARGSPHTRVPLTRSCQGKAG